MPYLILTDGTTTVNFGDTTGNYPVLQGGYTPAIAGLRHSELGGRGPYEDIAEEIVCDVKGASASAAYSNLATLARLLDQAERWARGENVAAVQVKYSPDGATVSSSGSPLQAAVLGRADGDQTSGVALPVEFDTASFLFQIRNVRMRFVRRGLWLHTSTTTSSSATANGDLATISIGSSKNDDSPTFLKLTNFYNGSNHGVGFVALAEELNRITIINAEGAAGGAWTSVNESAQFARNTNVLRYTPTGTSEDFSASITSMTFASDARLMGLYASIRNNSATTSFQIRARMQEGVSFMFTPKVVVPAGNTTKPQWYFLGLVAARSVIANYISLGCTASAASGSIDIDTVVAVDFTQARSAVVAVYPLYGTTSGFGDLDVNHNLDASVAGPAPRLQFQSNDAGIPYAGDPVLVTRNATLYALLMGTGGASTTNRWRQETGAAVVNNTWTAIRLAGYLTPV